MIDLMTYLHNAFEEAKLEVVLESCDDMVGVFIAFSKKHLKGNPPVSVFVTHGLGLRLADSTEVTMIESPTEEEAVTESTPVTKPRSSPGQFGIRKSVV